MTPITINRATLVTLSLCIGIIVGAGTVFGRMNKYMPATIIQSVKDEADTRKAADDSMRVERAELRSQMRSLINTLSLFAAVMAEPANSPERREALIRLRRMRRFQLEEVP